MSLFSDSWLLEPLYSLADFDRLFDEAFDARTSEEGGNEVARRGHGRRGHKRRHHGNELQRRPEPSTDLGLLRPRMDIHEDAGQNIVTATFELPGLKKEDVSIDIRPVSSDTNVLTVSGESKISSQHDENGYAIRERRFGRFERSVALPKGIRPEDVTAKLENGILTVTYPRVSPQEAPKRIAIS
ncbi:HSP20-like chaperone [Panus rudis PR-1116 ss-1]|nr:HSP20-like chaperone [Panus rudis PR-1116 ss-1]